MIWATVSSQSCFCSLHRASPSSAAKNIINLISVLTISPCVGSLLCLWKKVFAMTSVFSWQNTVSPCPASFCTLKPNLPITPDISWLRTFAIQSPVMNRTSFFLVLVLAGLLDLHRIDQLQLLSASVVGAKSWISVMLNGLPWKWTEIILSFLRLQSKYCISESFVYYEDYSISSKGFFPTVVDIMVIWV